MLGKSRESPAPALSGSREGPASALSGSREGPASALTVRRQDAATVLAGGRDGPASALVVIGGSRVDETGKARGWKGVSKPLVVTVQGGLAGIGVRSAKLHRSVKFDGLRSAVGCIGWPVCRVNRRAR